MKENDMKVQLLCTKGTQESSEGMLSKYTNPDLVSLEKSAWADSAEEKYRQTLKEHFQ